MSAERLFVENLRLIDDTIRLVCRNRHCSPEEREDFSSHSRLKFIEDDYAILRKYAGRCSLRTYLVTVIGHQLSDYRRQHWGTWRPSAEARRLGPAAMELDTLLHRDRVPLEEAIERLATSGRFAETRGHASGVSPSGSRRTIRASWRERTSWRTWRRHAPAPTANS